METEIIKIRPGEGPVSEEDEEKLRAAGAILQQGGLVAFPTETVYGLGGDALNPSSSQKIYAAKGRPSDNPLIVHIYRFEDIYKITKEVPEQARKIADAFWPGPLTMILPKSDAVPYETTGGLDTVAIRMPSHPAAQKLIKYSGGYIAAPSANTSGKPSPTVAKYVEEDMMGRIDAIIDGGEVGIGLESTIIDLTVTRDYTVMSNHHLRDKSLSLKAKGLLSLMLSLPEDWNYTTRGLAKICKEGTDSIGSALKELERAGYIVRNRLRDSKGKIVDVEYVIYETPHPPEPDGPCEDEPDTEHPDTENPNMDTPGLENRPQLNKDKSNPDKSKKDLSSTEGSNPILSSPQTPRGSDRAGRDWMRERESYRELILENIEYDILVQNERLDRDRLDELVELMVDTVCSHREMIRIAGDDYPAEVVKSRFLKLNSSHIEYVLDRMRENTTYVRNIKKYLLAALYNAPATIDSYYTSLVSHDMYGSGERR